MVWTWTFPITRLSLSPRNDATTGIVRTDSLAERTEFEMPVPICEQDDSIKLSLRHRDELGFAYFRITFEVDNLHIERIREELEYGGLRLRTIANLSRARINVVIDIGFGDAVEPGLEEIEFPVLLESPAPRLWAYPRETAVKISQVVILDAVVGSAPREMVQYGLINGAGKYQPVGQIESAGEVQNPH
jgi:hypothetical protein